MMKFKKVDFALNFVAPDEEIMERLGGRRTCNKCGAIYHIKNMPSTIDGVCDKCSGRLVQRSDEKPDVIKNRLEIYKEKTKPVSDYFQAKGMLVTIDANYPIDEMEKIIAQCDEKLQTLV
jgi:adenylate kinase